MPESGAAHWAAGVETRPKRRLGSAARLAAFNALVLALVLGVAVGALVHQFSASYEDIAGRGLVSEMRSFASQVPAQPGRLLADAEQYLRNHEIPAGTVLAIGDGSGHFVATGTWVTAFVRDASIRRALQAPGTGSSAHSERLSGRSVEIIVAPIRVGGRVVGGFAAATDLAPFQSDRSRVLALSIGEASVALLVGVLSTFLLLRRLLRKVGRITGAAEEIGAGDVERRLGDQGTDDEVGAARVLANRDFRLGAIPDVILDGDPDHIRGALLNLIDNAAHATGPGGVIELWARLDPPTGDLVVGVDDSGPGIPPQRRAHVLARFESTGAPDVGHGLGLAIVKAVVEAHKAKISILDSPYGGASMVIRFPRDLISVGAGTEVARGASSAGGPIDGVDWTGADLDPVSAWAREVS